MSQLDMKPTLLALLGSEEAEENFGINVLNPGSTAHYALTRMGTFRITGPRYHVEWDADADKVIAVYDIQADPTQTDPIPQDEADVEELESMLRYGRGFLQNWSERMHGRYSR